MTTNAQRFITGGMAAATVAGLVVAGANGQEARRIAFACEAFTELGTLVLIAAMARNQEKQCH